MALYDIDVLGNVIDVAFSPGTSSIAVLYLGGIDFYKWNICANKSPPILAGSHKFQDNMLGKRQYQQIAFGERDEIITLHVENATSSLQHYQFNKEVCEIEEKLWPSGASLALMISSFGEDRLIHPFTQGSSGDLHCLASGDKSLVNYSFPTFLPWVEVVKNLQDFIFFGLSRSGYLYAGPRLLAKNCTSFLVTPAHLIFTTTTHLLKFVHMASIEGKTLSYRVDFTKLL
jgi:elongator complex protein 1